MLDADLTVWIVFARISVIYLTIFRCTPRIYLI